MEFSSDLLKSFMEDLEAFTDDVAKANKPAEMADCCERILSLIQVRQLIFLKFSEIFVLGNVQNRVTKFLKRKYHS
jgi:hypothetical protein